ncbi:HPr family phosphocarrier protein [Thalassotalea agarivorans]|uniref:HPr-like nitrogen-regulatory protein NPr n=1 Tax=Thalassotalea agarivorans TaxID=349064 RepID=A0A1I0FTJ6_THASX|nr:HPr family phosphocarrier protein [Thalassotalea agarivorans]SET61529.1 HPr-like nitrogen-regulatory protein NPr [Thalassotalea agarivorans]
MSKLSRDVIITNKLGLHARAATKLAQLCQQFESKVAVTLAGSTADASSIMGIMLLAGSQGKQVTVETEGKDAAQALAAVCQLFSDNFDEEE